MRKISILLAVVSLLATACSANNDPGSGDTDQVDDTVAQRTDTDQGSLNESSGIDEIWVPSSLALTDFVEVELNDAGLALSVVESSSQYSEIEADARSAISQGRAALVPATIGEAILTNTDVTVHARMFESDDAEAAVSQLGVWLISTASGIEPATAEPSGLSIVLASADFAAQSDGNDGADIDVAAEVMEIAAEEVDALVDSKIQTATFGAGAAVVEELAVKYGQRAGASVGARSVAKFAGPVGGVLDFMYTMYQFEEAASEMIEAESNARISAYDTGMTAVAMLSDAYTRLCGLEAPIITGDLEGADATELIESLARSANRAVNIGDATVRDLNDLGDEDAAAQIAQLIEARNRSLQKKVTEMLTLARDRSIPSLGDDFISSGVTRILSPALSTESWEKAAAGALDKLFNDAGKGNTSRHSNGVLTVESAGETDILRHGQLWFATGLGGPGLDTLFPCGPNDNGGFTICGGSPVDAGTFTLIIVEYDGPLPTGPSDRLYQYGVVLDTDGDPGNNYRAGTSFPNDTWDNTDSWYEVSGGPSGLSLNVTDPANFSSVDSGARVAILDNTMAFFIPPSEISGSPTDPAVMYRATSFWHLGGFGLNPPADFNIDASPIVGEPLALPAEIVKLDGPPGAPTLEYDDVLLDAASDRITSGLGGFTPSIPNVDDPTPLGDEPACWASAHFFENPTELAERRFAFVYDGSAVDVRVAIHDTASAARGEMGLRRMGANAACRDALIMGATGSTDLTSDLIWDEPHGGVTRTRFDIDGTPFESTSGVFHEGELVVRFSVVGPGDTSMVTDQIIGAVVDGLLTP